MDTFSRRDQSSEEGPRVDNDLAIELKTDSEVHVASTETCYCFIARGETKVSQNSLREKDTECVVLNLTPSSKALRPNTEGVRRCFVYSRYQSSWRRRASRRWRMARPSNPTNHYGTRAQRRRSLASQQVHRKRQANHILGAAEFVC